MCAKSKFPNKIKTYYMTNSIANYKNSYLLCAFIFLFSINTNAQNAQGLYNTIQNIYSRYKSIPKNNCTDAQKLVINLQQYTNSKVAVPAAKAYSVNFPKTVTNPSIGDLANDRIARIKSQYKSCFESENVSSEEDLTLYNQVQNIYIKHTKTDANNCIAIKDIIEQLKQYRRSRVAVPSSKAYTVSFPQKMTNPSIGDLAKDRIERLKRQYKSCFDNNINSTYFLQNLLGSWKYVHQEREYQFFISKQGKEIVGHFKSHKYSYPPIFKGASILENNRVRFIFELGGSHIVNLEFGYDTTSGTFAFIAESWSNNFEWKRLNLTKEKPMPTVAASITFLNQTKSAVDIYWVKSSGEEVKYKTLSAGQAYVQETYSTHQWRIRLNGSQYLNYTTTKDRSQLVKIQ